MKKDVSVLLIFLTLWLSFGISLQETIDVTLQENEIMITFIPLRHGEAVLVKNNDNQAILIDLSGENNEKELLKILNFYQVHQLEAFFVLKETEEIKEMTKRLIKEIPIKQVMLPSSHQVEEQMVLPFLDEFFIQFIQTNPTTMSVILHYGKNQLLVTNDTEVSFLNNFSQTVPFSLVYIHRKMLNIETLESLIKQTKSEIILFRSKKEQSELIEKMKEKWVEMYNLNALGHVIITCTKEEYDMIFLDMNQ